MIYTVKRGRKVRPYHTGFNHVLGSENQAIAGKGFYPSINLLEQEDRFVIELAAPGLKKEDFNLNIENGVLSIMLERKVEKAESEKVHRQEWGAYRFERRFELGNKIDAERIGASYESGVLKIDLPKSENARPRSIKVD